MAAIGAWSPQQFFYFFMGLAYLLVWLQVGLFHWRGAFRHWAMWGPISVAPLLILAGLLYPFFYGGWRDTLFVLVFVIGALDGLAGLFYHFMGVRHYVGGFNLRNVMVGPPVILPTVFFALSAAVLLVYAVWGVR